MSALNRLKRGEPGASLVGRAMGMGIGICCWAMLITGAGGAAEVEVRGEEWPSFRGPNGTGLAREADPPVRWNVDRGEQVRWKRELPGLGHASPIVCNGRVIVTTAVSSDPEPEFRYGLFGDVDPAKDVSEQRWVLLAVDAEDGAVIWEREASRGKPKTKRHVKASFASATPATDGQYIVALFGSEGLFCYGWEGEVQWHLDLGVLNAGWFYDPDYEWGNGSSPILHRERVIVQADVQGSSFIAAFALSDGRELWRTAREEIPSWSTPSIYEKGGEAQVVANGTRAIRGYDFQTGEVLWWLEGNSEIVVPTPVIAGDIAYVTSGYRPIQPIYAIDLRGRGDLTLETGVETSEHVLWSKRHGGPYIPTPLVYDDLLYVCANSSILSVYEAQTGERVYQERLGQGPTAFTASPVAAGGRVYFTSEEGTVFVVKSGREFEVLASNEVGDVCLATPAIGEETFYVRSQQYLQAFGR